MKISLGYIITIGICLLSVSATLYSVRANYTVIYERTYDQLAYAQYQEYSYERGWNYLHIHANERKGLTEQHRGAGFLQGYVSYRDIYSAYRNLCGSNILNGEAVSVGVQNYIEQQLGYIDSMVESHPFDIYWKYAGAYLEQLRYMYRGYLTRINVEKSLNLYIGFTQFYYLTNSGDLQDLIYAFKVKDNQGQGINSRINITQLSSAYIKKINNKLDIGHSTINSYQFMLRVFKTYQFPNRDPSVGSQWFSFSSRPGDLISKDDFYVLSAGFVVMETSLLNFNADKYKQLNSRSVPSWLRATIAANLARNGNEWIDYFLKARSGTRNSQWIIADPKTISKNENVVVFLEEAFNIYQITDMTDLLNEQGYVGAYNIPYQQKIYNELGYQECTYPHNTDQYTYESDPRGSDYQNYNRVIQNIEDMKRWLITNNGTNSSIGIAPRYDLDWPNPKPFGLSDCKIVEVPFADQPFVWAFSGPTISGGKFPPFQWANWMNISHQGLARKWNFTWEKYEIIPVQSQLRRVYSQ